MEINYDLWFVRRDDDGGITEVGVNFFEGEVSEKDEMDTVTNEIIPVTCYRRVKKLHKEDMVFMGNRKTLKTAFIYTPKDFGAIKTDKELDTFLNTELDKDEIRTNHEWQL